MKSEKRRAPEHQAPEHQLPDFKLVTEFCMDALEEASGFRDKLKGEENEGGENEGDN